MKSEVKRDRVKLFVVPLFDLSTLITLARLRLPQFPSPVADVHCLFDCYATQICPGPRQFFYDRVFTETRPTSVTSHPFLSLPSMKLDWLTGTNYCSSERFDFHVPSRSILIFSPLLIYSRRRSFELYAILILCFQFLVKKKKKKKKKNKKKRKERGERKVLFLISGCSSCTWF